MKFTLSKSPKRVILNVFIQDSSSVVGAGLGSLDETSSIAGSYTKHRGLGVAIACDENVATEGTWVTPTAAANIKIGTPANAIAGTYELHFHNDVFEATNSVSITLGGATNMVPLLIEIQCVGDIHTWHVATTGNDADGGHSYDDALLTVGQAITNASNGDTIFIHPGDYTETGITCAGKELNFIGESRYHSKIVPATGVGIVLADNCSLTNLAVEALEESSGVYGVNAGTFTGVIIRNCDIHASFDGVYASTSVNLKIYDSKLRGTYDGMNCVGAKAGHFVNTTFESLGTYTGAVGARGVMSGEGIYDNCIFIATKASGTPTYGNGITCDNLTANYDLVVLNNCLIRVNGGTSTGEWSGIKTENTAKVVLNNCVVQCVAGSADTGPYDLYQTQTSELIVNNTRFSTSNGTILNEAADILVDTGTTLEAHLTDIKGTGFVKDTDSLVDVAHIGADADTLETLSDEIAGIATAAGQPSLE